MKIFIIFFGLIVHVNQPWSLNNTAVLPRAADHKALLKIPAGTASPKDAWLAQWKQQDNSYQIALNDLAVELKGTRGIFLDVTQAQQKHVPKLSQIVPSCNRLKRAVLDRTPTAQFASFFDYRAGDIAPLEYFSVKLGFPDSPESAYRCVACKVQYTSELKEDHAVLVFREKNGTEHEYKIAGNSNLVVQNIPDPPSSGHFLHHFSVLQHCWGPEPDPKYPCTDGETCKLGDEPFPGVDCANSQYP